MGGHFTMILGILVAEGIIKDIRVAKKLKEKLGGNLIPPTIEEIITEYNIAKQEIKKVKIKE